MRTVLLRAPVLVQSGYGIHALQIYKYLRKKNIKLYVQPLNWGHCPWIIDEHMHDGLIGEIMRKTNVPQNFKFDYTFQLQLPHEWDTNLGNINIGMTAGVESTRCHPEWINYCNKMDLVVVPSTHIKNVFINSGNLIKPIENIPESYIEAIDKNIQGKINLDHVETNFNFLVFGQFTGNLESDRKNTFSTIEWICEAFKDNKDIGIILKTNCGKNTTIDRHNTTKMLKDFVTRIKKNYEYPKIYLLHGTLNDEEIASLYKHPKVKAFISFTRAEGWNLPLMEAAASDLPILATNWSGHLDFMNKGKFIKIDYDLKEIPDSRVDNKIWIKESKWAEPRKFYAIKALKKFKESHDVPKQWAVELGKTIRKEFCQSEIEKKYDEVLSKYGIIL